MKKSHIKITGVLSLAFAFLLLAVTGCEPPEDSPGEFQEEEASVEQEAPSFDGEEFTSGELREFPADWEGDVVYLNFFSTG